MENRQYVFKKVNGVKTIETAGSYGTSYQRVSLNATALQEEATYWAEIPRFNTPSREVCKVIPMKKKASRLKKIQRLCLAFFNWSVKIGVVLAFILPLFAQIMGDYSGIAVLYMLFITTIGTLSAFALLGSVPLVLVSLLNAITR